MAIPISGNVRELLGTPSYVHLSTLRPDGSPRNWVVWVGLEGDHILVCTSDAICKAIVGGTPTQQGTFTFTVDNVPFSQPGAPPSQSSYSITVGPPLPLQVVLPASGSTLSPGTEGKAYAQNFFVNGGVAPYTWSLASGKLPSGLALRSTDAPADNNNQLAGTPTQAGTFKFTMKVADGSGQSASQQFSLTIKNGGGGNQRERTERPLPGEPRALSGPPFLRLGE
jgi:hypothetical protein